MCGVDFTRIEGIDVTAALVVMSEVGAETAKFPSHKHFASWLGAYYRRLCARMNKPKAVTAAAHQLARLFYPMLTKGEEYTDRGQAYCEERYRQRVVASLNRRAQQLGLQGVPMAAPAAASA